MAEIIPTSATPARAHAISHARSVRGFSSSRLCCIKLFAPHGFICIFLVSCIFKKKRKKKGTDGVEKKGRRGLAGASAAAITRPRKTLCRRMASARVLSSDGSRSVPLWRFFFVVRKMFHKKNYAFVEKDKFSKVS